MLVRFGRAGLVISGGVPAVTYSRAMLGRPPTPASLAVVACLAVAAGGCAAAGSTTQAGPGAASTASGSASSARHHRSSATARDPAVRHHHARRTAPGGAALAVSTVPGDAVAPQPAPGSCHARGSGLYSLPDPRCTPGAVNPAVTQSDIQRTICVPGYTKTIRPPESITEAEKRASIAAYGDSGAMGDYEYDHLVSLELGGAANDPRNLWPEPGASPNPKDAVENELHRMVCDGEMTLARAQRTIATNWIAFARSHSAALASSSASASPGAGPNQSGAGGSPRCSVTASYSSRYGDWDVDVHSDQPDTTVTVSDDSGRRRSWHTDRSGYADVYFKAPAGAAGEAVTVHAGAATCRTRLESSSLTGSPARATAG